MKFKDQNKKNKEIKEITNGKKIFKICRLMPKKDNNRPKIEKEKKMNIISLYKYKRKGKWLKMKIIDNSTQMQPNNKNNNI